MTGARAEQVDWATDFCDDTTRYLVEHMLGRRYDSLRGRDRGSTGAFRYDPFHRACWSLRDPVALRVLRDQNRTRRRWPWLAAHYATALFRNEYGCVPLFSMKPTRNEGMVIYPSSDTTVAVILREQRVLKISRLDSPRSGFLFNEVEANARAPELAAPVLDFRTPNTDPGYVITAYIPNNRPVQRAEWYAVLRQLQGPLVDMYQTGLRTLSSLSYIDNTHCAVATLKLEPQSWFDRMAESLLQQLLTIAQSWADNLGSIPVPVTFVHGDLTRDNVRRSNRSLKLIDWEDGGWRHLLYDLFIQEYYQPNSSFWRMYPAAKLSDYGDSFYGWSRVLVPAIETITQRMTAPEFNFHILCCLLERALMTVQRCRRREELRGRRVLGRIKLAIANLQPSTT